MVEISITESFSEDAGPVQVCATLMGMTAVSIDVTVSAMNGNVMLYIMDYMMQETSWTKLPKLQRLI